MNTLFLGIGGNMGDRRQYMHSALIEITSKIGTLIQKSAIYETSAWGKENQAPFLNQVIQLSTELESQKVLQTCLAIEKNLGRIRKEKWDKRTIDIDILFYNNAVINTKDLTIPHPLLHLRNFTLIPLQEIAKEFIHPVFHKSIDELANQCDKKLEVFIFED